MTDLVPSMIVMDKGLDLQTAKIAAPPGTILDTLNYEQVDFQGQKRIDGFARYDGSHLAALQEYYVFSMSSVPSTTPGSMISVGGVVLGVVLDVEDNDVFVAVINYKVIPLQGEELEFMVNGSASTFGTVDSVSLGINHSASPDEHYERLVEYNNVLRNKVENLPGPVAGLHWFRDRLYAVASLTVAAVTVTGADIRPNDVVQIDGDFIRVLDVLTTESGTYLFVDDMNYDRWQEAGTVVNNFSGVPVATITANFAGMTGAQEIASFFESRTEAQAIEEDAGPTYDYGWRHIPLGWMVRFYDGVSYYGRWIALNQNIEGAGTMGPTTIVDNNGAAVDLIQNIDITGTFNQVNGWKSTTTRDQYTLREDDILDAGDAMVYGDAYISWEEGDTEATVLSDQPVEYSPVNSVRVELDG